MPPSSPSCPTTPRQNIAYDWDYKHFDELIEVRGSYKDLAEVWMTNVTLQGNGDDIRDCDNCGLRVADNASVYAEGVTAVAQGWGAFAACLFQSTVWS